MPKLTRRSLLQAAAASCVPAMAHGAGPCVTIAWDRPRAAPGDPVRVIVRGCAKRASVTIQPPSGPAIVRTLELVGGRAEIPVHLPAPRDPGVRRWSASAAGATAHLEVVANRFAFGL